MKQLLSSLLAIAILVTAVFLSAAGPSYDSWLARTKVSHESIQSETSVPHNAMKAETEVPRDETQTETSVPRHATQTETGVSWLSDKSVYHLKSRWMSQLSDDVEWSSLRGRPLLVAMFYSHCGFTCPRIVHDLKGILSELPRSERRMVGVVLVSIDPEHDTPEALKAFSEMHDLESPQWTLLTGADADIRELAAALNIRYKRQPGGEFAHSNTITLLSADGDILARRDGFDTSIDVFASQVAALANSSGWR